MRNPLITLIGLTLLLAAPAAAQFDFAPTLSVPVGPQPGGVATGDLDGDGDVDLATGIRFPDRVVVMLNDGKGGFAAGPVIDYPAHSEPEEVVAGDLDGDGDVDLAVILRFLSEVRIALNQGGGVFTHGSSAPIGFNGRGMDIDDHDGDGDLDLAVANRGSNTATVLTNDGAANFTSATLASAGEPRAAAFGDLDGDGDLDLAVTNNDAFNVRLFRNDGGVFSAWQILSTAPDQAEGVFVADLDNDGNMDIATGAEDDNTGINRAVVFMNGGGGAFGPRIGYPTDALGTSGVVAADLDCDGWLDLALANQDTNNLSLLRNNGDGTFGPAQHRNVGTNPETLAMADLDGDGLMDLATANRDSSNLS
ncbi:MAG: VCBS repeat-containing protein, partial [Phycisphaerae bacterium]|nr:VCBS repeat-containing protein [Phycisphaerae bacterium]